MVFWNISVFYFVQSSRYFFLFPSYVGKLSACDADASSNDWQNLMCEMNDFRKRHPKQWIVSHLNINSLRNKFPETDELYNQGMSDILFQSECKLDQLYLNAHFKIPDCKINRVDRNIHEGDIVARVSSDLAHQRRPGIEQMVPRLLESLVLEVIIRKEKWLYEC